MSDSLDFNIYPELTKDYILSCVSEEEIFAKYLGIPIKEVNVTDPICNPLRTDEHADCRFYVGDDNRLRFTDFAGYTANGRFKSWDCFDCVIAVINMTEKVKVPYYTKNKEKRYAQIYLNISPTAGYISLEEGGRKYKLATLSFSIMLKHIAKQFKIHKYSGASTTTELKRIKPDLTIKRKKNVFTTMLAKVRDWNQHDLKYWKKYHADLRNPQHRAMFKFFGINPLYEGYVNNHCVYRYSKYDLGYSYYEGKDELNRKHMKFYFPFRTGKEKYKPKFYCNTKRLQGLAQLTPGYFGILQKSKKDVLLQRLHFGLTGVAPQAESNLLTVDEWHKIRHVCDVWVSIGDFDYAGVRFGIMHYVHYGIIPLFFVRANTPIKKWLPKSKIRLLYQEFGVKVVDLILRRPVREYFTAKDFSDNLEERQVKGMLTVVNSTIKQYMPIVRAFREYTANKFDEITNLNFKEL